VLKASKVDGVYDNDPVKDPEAKRLDNLTLHEAAGNHLILVMDRAAIGLAAEQGKAIVVFDAMKPGNLKKLIQGEQVGTKIS